MKKILYLFLALLLPGLIFVFLKYAGKNEFVVPVYHDKGVIDPPSDCNISYPSPYIIPDSVRSLLNSDQELNAIIFTDGKLDVAKIKTALKDELGDNAINVINAIEITGQSSGILRECIFLLNDPFQSVLVSKEGIIRGYYDLSDRDEMDRLRVELKILLKKY
ncbi:MAG: hypothetical protein HOP08_02900 [Cyclobacteriaceae bacterium]|nr:hypothetical protein [Cyclobacteriaceae bacterium]